ncbi:MAG TPA: glycosyltransferase family 4 protein [Bryobacteraceae bacterium]|nr:glycosyltransferase family 4 protein [Bryobacteraceae bacterium]
MLRVLYTAAHGGFSSEAVPLGGGAAVFEHLVEEWQRTRPFELQTLTPAILGSSAPRGGELVKFGERAYARFCREFERTSTAEILRHDPARTVVLANDVSEGPDFARLAARGYRVYTIYHVDVVAYVSAIYGHGLIAPETTVRWYRRLRWCLPEIAQLVWDKQESSVRHSRGLIVPSEGMCEVLLRCYPDCGREKIHVLPWGNWNVDATGDPEPLLREFGVPQNARVLLTLSRISPEKGQDLLLKALLEWERRDDYPAYPLWLFVCGDAAFMQGQRFLEKLRELASRLKRTRVVFPGYITGERKRAFLALADLYVFPSRHESYGLTLMEALAAGLPAVCLDTSGSRSVMREEFGVLVPESGLRAAIATLLADEGARQNMGAAARAFAQRERFSDRAAELASLLAANERV